METSPALAQIIAPFHSRSHDCQESLHAGISGEPEEPHSESFEAGKSLSLKARSKSSSVGMVPAKLRAAYRRESPCYDKKNTSFSKMITPMHHDEESVNLRARNVASDNGNARCPEKRILVVDDDPSVREMLTRVLTGEGYLVWAAANGAEALKIAAAVQLDLVLLDLNMPVKSGWDTFESLTANNPWLAVIIITARSNQLFTALGSGVGALLEKPLDFPRLLQTVSNLLREPAESRIARMAGKPAEFHYLPTQHKEEPK